MLYIHSNIQYGANILPSLIQFFLLYLCTFQLIQQFLCFFLLFLHQLPFLYFRSRKSDPSK